ncbi:MAG: hypothetical protein IGR80_14425 [Synechococcales cyanobacterium K44_A2020_017]|nr:hypothetical protein [Synechococcales cyanobacterium K32_A2020_035]MBF2095939.1 hypothetical protein [Synechococcales cyanobacterium K44_A2020_017]
MIYKASLSPEDIVINPSADIVIEVQRLAGRIARYLELPIGKIFVTFSPSLSCPAQVELSMADDYLVRLHERYRFGYQDVPALLAHEIVHIFLHRLKIAFPHVLDNEILTDTAATYLGLGWPCLNAFRISVHDSHEFGYVGPRTIRHVSASKVGYLTPEEFAYVLAKRSLLFNERIDRLLTLQARELYRQGLRVARREGARPPFSRSLIWWRWLYLGRRWWTKRLPQTGKRSQFADYRFEWVDGEMKVTFDCPVCCQKLRLPTERRQIHLDCPTCQHSCSCRT